MSLAERRAPERRAAERERDPIIRAQGGEGGNGDAATSQSGGRGAVAVGSL